MKKVLIGILIAAVVVSVGCGSNPDSQKYIENNTPKEDVDINWWDKAEEYNSAKEYSKGDIVMFEGEVSRMYWYKGSANTYHIDGCGAKWSEVNDFSMQAICNQLYFGGKIKIVGEYYGNNSFFIKGCEIVEAYSVTLDSYITDRAKIDTNGISVEEAAQLNNWCKESEEIMMFEQALEPNIFDIYPELLGK